MALYLLYYCSISVWPCSFIVAAGGAVVVAGCCYAFTPNDVIQCSYHLISHAIHSLYVWKSYTYLNCYFMPFDLADDVKYGTIFIAF